MQYHIARNGQQAGTFSEEEVRARLQTNEFSPSDLCWTDGMADWQPLGARFATPVVLPGGNYTADPSNPYAPPQATLVAPARTHNLELASLGDRFVAQLLNMLFMLLSAIPAVAIGFALHGKMADEQAVVSAMAVWALTLLIFLCYNAYLLSVRGQSLAKKIVGIRIVTHPDGAMPGAGKAFWVRAFLNYIMSNIIPLYGLVDVCFIFREDRRCIHDLMAGTMVVKGQPPGF